MTKRSYSPEEIKEIHKLAQYEGEELRTRMTMLAIRQNKPFECIKKRLDYEITTGQIKQTEMKQARFSTNEEYRIEELKLCKSEKERKEKATKLAAELGYTYHQIRSKFWHMQNNNKKQVQKITTSKVEVPKAVPTHGFAVEIPLSSFDFEVTNGKLRYWPKI